MVYDLKNINETTPMYLGEKLGYEVFIPNFMYNHISFNKRNCPIWIKINDKGDCYVFLQERDGDLENEITEIITKYLPKKKALHCCRFSSQLQDKAGVHDSDEFGLNSACVDENNELQAYVIVGSGKIKDDNVMIVKRVWYLDKKPLSMLRDYLLREENVEEYRSKELWHSMTDETIVETLHFIDRGNGFYSWQFE